MNKVLLTTVGFLIAGASQGATNVWTGAADGNWDATSGNWSGGTYTANDAVQFGDTSGANLDIVLPAAATPTSINFTDTGEGSNAYTFNGGSIDGAGALTLDSGFGGSVELGVANGYTGGTTINSGSLILNDSGALGSGDVTLNGGMVTLNVKNINVANNLNVTDATSLVVTKNARFSGDITGAGTLNTGGSGNDQGGASLYIYDLSGFTGTLVHDNVNNLNNLMLSEASVSTAKLKTTGDTTSSRYLAVNVDMEFGELSGDGGYIVSSSTKTLTINQSTDTTYGGHLGSLSDTKILNFEKTGVGTLEFTFDNDYTGTTKVSGGTLIVNGDQSGATGAVSVDSGATLMGSGTIGGVTTVGGFLKPGNSPGKLTFAADLSLNDGSMTTLEIVDLTNFDALANDGEDTITFASGSDIVFDFDGASVSEGDEFQIFENWATLTDEGATIVVKNLDSEYSLNTDNLFKTGMVTVIPEPATIGMLGLGAVVVLAVRGHRRH